MPIPLPIIKFLIRTGIAARMPAVRALVPEPSYLRFYSDRILMAPNEPVVAMNAYLNRATRDCIDLSLGAPCEAGLRPPLPPAEELYAGSGYPPAVGMPELREAVANKLLRDNRIEVSSSDEVAILNGVSQAIHVVFDTFVNPGDKVVLADPTFLVYALAAQYHRARVKWIPSWIDHGCTKLDGRRLERAMRGAKLIVVNSPSNPTGGVMEPETLEHILHLAKRHDVIILSDEVYERFVYEGTHTSIASLAGARARTITVNSFSKSHAMAGCRIGYMAAIRYLMRPMMAHQFIATPFAAVASQRLAIRALAEPPHQLRRVLAEYDVRRQWLDNALRTMGLECDLPVGAFYFWIPIHSFGLTSLEFANRLLDSHKVLLMPGENFGPSGPGHVRISYAAPQSRLEEGCQRLASFIAELRGAADLQRAESGGQSAESATAETVRFDARHQVPPCPNRPTTAAECDAMIRTRSAQQ
jgi:aminotransferase